jgi:hypothetical protein
LSSKTDPTVAAILESSQVANGDNIAPSNQDDLDTLAQVMAKDYYLFNLGKVDLIFPGIVAWIPEATSDNVECTHTGTADAGMVSTRVQRGYTHTHIGQPPPAPSGGGMDINSFRQSGRRYTFLNTVEAVVACPVDLTDTIVAVPFIVPITQSFNKIEVYLMSPPSGFAGNTIQLAIYDTAAPNNLALRNVIVHTGDLVMGTSPIGFVGATIAVTLTPGLYWLAVNASYRTNVADSFAFSLDFVGTILGYYDYNTVSAGANTPDSWAYKRGAQTYGTWVNNPAMVDFPFAITTSPLPMIYLTVA